VVRLSAAEREMAEMMGMKPEDYAKHKVALKKEGKIQ
jgi:phage I-like protein